MKFKPGDRVKLKYYSFYEYPCYKGQSARIIERSDGCFDWRIQWNDGYTSLAVENNLILVEEATTMKKATWGVKYDLDEDPVEFFETKKKAEKRVQELLEDDEVQKDSIWMFEIGDKYKVEKPKPTYKLIPANEVEED